MFTDSLVRHIERSTLSEFNYAQSIIKRLHQRDLYKCVGEKMLDSSYCERLKTVKAQDIVNCQNGDGTLRAEDIIVHQFVVNYGFGHQNPVDLVTFYKDSADVSMIGGFELNQDATIARD